MSEVTAPQINGYELVEPRAPLRPAVRPPRALAPGEALIRVAGCGVCHTDLGFLDEGVRTRRPPPLILGHEISGFVEAAGAGCAGLIGRAVVVPAVLPCGECALCQAGRPMLCKKQIMPGNDCDGGFADRVILPGKFICPVPGAGENFDAPLGTAPGLTLRHLAVVADAVSTAYQAVLRSGVKAGDLAVVVGLGGVGGFAAQLAAERGAVVLGIDTDARRRTAAAARGTVATIDPSTLTTKALRDWARDFAKARGASEAGWSLFECSGNPAGQAAAFGLLGPGATLMIVGYTMAQVEVRLSNLMAFDARMLGNWGCAPEHYPEILRLALSGRVDIAGQAELRPLSRIDEALAAVRQHKAERRIILVPDQGRLS